MPKRACFVLSACLALILSTAPAQAAPPSPADLQRAIATARTSIADYERILAAYDVEMRATVANDPTSVKRREEIRILKQYYVREIEALKTKINDDYRRIQAFRTHGSQ